MYKPRERNNEVPWHQDFLSRPNESTKFIAWIAIDNATRENGCIKVIPGSHTNGFYQWHRVKGETHHDRISDDLIDTSKAVYVEIDAGDVLIFNQYLLHSSERSNSDHPRRAYRVVYKKIDSLDIPRGSPIMLSGGSPEGLERIVNDQEQKFNKIDVHDNPRIKMIINKIGQKLAQF